MANIFRTRTTDTMLANVIHDNAHPMTGASQDYVPLLEMIGDARFVLIGEASHGTHEFCMIHVDETRALEPLERTAGWESGEVPETYPTAA